MHDSKLEHDCEFIWDPTRNLYNISVGLDIYKMAIVSGRKLYRDEWGKDEEGKTKYIDIGPAYENMDSIIKTLNCLGFKEIIQLVDPTYVEME